MLHCNICGLHWAQEPPYNHDYAALQQSAGPICAVLTTLLAILLARIQEIDMSLTPDQILSAHKANLETLFGLTSKAFEGVEKLVELNVTASRAALNEVAQHSQAVLGAKDAQELLALQANLFQPLAEKTAAYSRHLYDIASGTSAELGKVVESQSADLQKNFAALVDSTAKNAPAGSETAVAVMRSAVSAANNAFESVQKAVKQASDMTQANINAVSATASEAAKSAQARKR